MRKNLKFYFVFTIIVFESPNCPHCQKLKKEFFPYISKLYNEKVEFFDLGRVENYKIYSENLKKIGLEVSLPSELPVVFYKNNVVVGEKEIKEKLPILLKGKNEIVSNKIKEITLPAIILAGLLDGINPCAFGVIVFFISFLIATGKSKERIIYTGIFYIFGVFLTYFFIGVFLKGIVNLIFAINVLVKFIFLISGIFCVLAGFLNIIEFKKDAREYKIKLPEKVKKRINQIIASFFMKNYHLPTSFFIGAIISIQESICTGQLYLPSILLISKFSRNFNLYLLIYNLFFIMPLIFIFLFVFFGMKSQFLSSILKKSLPLTKSLVGIIFLFLGSLLIIHSFIR
jgi:cytochrome c biogenesis protein CcdA